MASMTLAINKLLVTVGTHLVTAQRAMLKVRPDLPTVKSHIRETDDALRDVTELVVLATQQGFPQPPEIIEKIKTFDDQLFGLAKIFDDCQALITQGDKIQASMSKSTLN